MAARYDAHNDKIRDIFGAIARVYDPMNRVITLGLWGSWQRRFLDLVAPRDGEYCLDIATGTGDLAILIADSASRIRVTGLDLSRDMLDVAEEKIRRRGLEERVTVVEGNALMLPFPDQTFDVVTCGFGLRNFPDLPQALSEMRRVLKPGGRALSLEVSRPQNKLVWWGFRLYFYGLVPRLGRLAGRGGRAYAWLPESHRRFPGREVLSGLYRDAGFDAVEAWPLTLGSVAVHRGEVRT
ncbi:MAG: ubiquinone/menaquinone biosynthesis methyltransferase [Thermaerobacter sp.]|nr:ubiquinone/menaquinone biosynthesis methyltransferase [Thermaerobacter sp.]